MIVKQKGKVLEKFGSVAKKNALTRRGDAATAVNIASPTDCGYGPEQLQRKLDSRIVKKSKPSQNRGLSGGRVASGAVLRYPPLRRLGEA
jgi:hypothetical protein